MKTCAIVLAAGSGRRMNSDVKKQYIEMAGNPVIYYSLDTFQKSRVDEIVMIVTPGDEEYCRKNIVERYGFTKVTAVLPGGKERYHSVSNGLKACGGCDYVLIHDGARAFISDDIINRCIDNVIRTKACVAAVKVKDTIKEEDGSGNIGKGLNRDVLWAMQTPQVFEYSLIRRCYDRLIDEEAALLEQGIAITDDTMVAELYSDIKVALVEGDYTNIKITTPDDLIVGEAILASETKDEKK